MKKLGGGKSERNGSALSSQNGFHLPLHFFTNASNRPPQRKGLLVSPRLLWNVEITTSRAISPSIDSFCRKERKKLPDEALPIPEIQGEDLHEEHWRLDRPV